MSLDASVSGVGGAERTRSARIAARTAAKAAGKAGCEAATPVRGSSRSFVSRPLTARERAGLKQFATRFRRPASLWGARPVLKRPSRADVPVSR